MVSTQKNEKTNLLKTRWSSELNLAQEASLGRLDAQQFLLNHLTSRVRNLCSYLTGGGNDQDDLAQNSLIAIISSIGTFKGESTLYRWADRITINTFYKHHKKKSRRTNLFKKYFQSHTQNEDYLESELDKNRIKQRMAELIGTLSPKKRTALILYHVNGCSIEEIAHITHTKQNTVRDRLQVAREDLRKKILADPLMCEWRKLRLK